MRRLRKQSTAIVLAAMMMGSVVPQGADFITPDVVMAATEEFVYDSGDVTAKADIDFSKLTKESWDEGGKVVTVFAYTNGAERNIKSNFKVNVRVGISSDDYKTLDSEGSYIKLQGVVKLGDSWTYTTGDSWPYLDKSAFSISDDGNYYAYASIDFNDKTASQLMEIDFETVGVGFKGTVNFDEVSVANKEETKQPELTPTDANVLDSFPDALSINSWSGEEGYQYFHGGDKNAAPVIAYDENSGDGRLKVSLDYTANSTEGWSEAKVKYIAKDGGVSISNYNQISVDLIYPESGNTVSKMKFFADGIINKDTIIDSSDAESLGNGYQKVKVTVQFSPKDTNLTDITIGLIGVNSDFSGDVYLDDLELSQKNDMDEFVRITSTVNENGTKAKVSTGDKKKITVTDDKMADCAVALQSYLNKLDDSDQVLFGHQNDVSRSVSTNDELGDVHDVTGSVSGVFGIDSLALTGSEAGGTDAKSALEKSVEYSKKAAQNGSIISLSAHMPNFTSSKIKKTDDGKYDFFNCDFAESKDLSNDSLKQILPGGDYNEVYRAYLDIIADYATQLQNDDIPVMFRPFHENTGAWFWWGSTNSEESYKSLYRYTRQYLESKGVHNMLYIYSPCGPVSSEDEVLSRYPGDEYVDILAFDYYDDYNSYPAESDGSYFDHLSDTCKIVSSVAKNHGKIAAIAECGVRVMKKDGSDNEGLLVKGNPVASEKTGKNWYKEVSDIAKENDMPYYLVWANFSDTNFYVPYKYNNEYGQEMINDFIDYYNDETSVFGDGTDFYGNMTAFANSTEKELYETTPGFMVSPFDMDELLDETTLRAYVKNASEVNFVITDTLSKRSVTIKGVPETDEAVLYKAGAEDTAIRSSSEGVRLYTAKLTKEIMDEIGKTDVASIAVEADGRIIQTIENVSLGKTKDAAAENVFDDFDYYSGSQSLLSAAYTENSAGGCSSSFSLDKDNKADGTYGGKFSYKLKTTGSEVWTGRVKSSLTTNDFSKYNALQMWVKPDGKGQKLVVQLSDGAGAEYEAYLTDFVGTTEAKYVTIPFENFHKKGSGASLNDVSNITKFAIWCNSYPAGKPVDVESAIYFDAIRAVEITDEQAALADANGLVITEDAIGLPKAGGDDAGKPDDGKKDDGKSEDGKSDTGKKDDASKADDKGSDDSTKTDDKNAAETTKADDKNVAETTKADDKNVAETTKADDKNAAETTKADDKNMVETIKPDLKGQADITKDTQAGNTETNNASVITDAASDKNASNVKATNDKKIRSDKKNKAPRGGDEQNVFMYSSIMGIAVLIISAILYRRKKRDRRLTQK